MSTSRLEAFSDGVIAIIITIMVLELKTPHGGNLADLKPLIPTFLAYVLSFQVVGTYWNNHHHLLHATKEVNGKMMWANLHLLFWLSLIPFATAWLGENYTHSWPTAIYGILLLLAACAYAILQQTIVQHPSNKEELTKKLGDNKKGNLSLVCYVLAILIAFVNPLFSDVLYVAVAIVWFIPDQRLVGKK